MKQFRRPSMLVLTILVATLVACGGPDDGTAARTDVDRVDPVTIEDPPDSATLQEILDRWRADGDAFGATLSLRVPGHGDVHVASGVDDRDPETPMPTNGTYQISSVTKTFVAATVLQLAEEGRLSLDDRVESWLPELENASEITVEMLLTHTAGLGDWSQPVSDTFDDYVATVTEDLARSFTPEEALALHTQVPTVGSPGERFFYTDAGYLALGLVIERELGQDLDAVIAERFTAPLALDETVLNDGSTGGTRHGWFAIDDDPELPLDIVDLPQQAIATSLWASAAMLSSSADMLDWGEALYSGDLLGEEATARMLETPYSVDQDVSYGLGAERYCFAGTDDCSGQWDLVGHTAHDGGTTAWVAFERRTGLTLVLHANIDDVDYVQMADLFREVAGQLGIDR